MMNSDASRRTRTTAVFAFAASIALVFATAVPASAAPVPVYDDYPAAAPHYTSLSYQDTSTSEFGDRITLGGTARILDTVTVSFVDWACESDFDFVDGVWVATGDPCTTNPAGASFTHPITVNVYAVDSTVTPAIPGALLATVTDTVVVPFRPSSSGVEMCPEFSTDWYDAATEQCYPGTAFDWTFDLSSAAVVLPNDVIVAVAHNTESYGATPIGTAGPYDSLNVTAKDAAPSVGTNTDPDAVYLDSTWAGAYSDGGVGGTGVLRQDLGWSTFNPVFRVAASTPVVPDPALADTGVDTEAMTAGTWIGGGVLVAGLALFGFAAYRKRAARR